MKVLITGVAGLLGSRLATWIIDNTDCQVVGIDNLSGGYLENIDSRVEFYNLDLMEDFDEIDKVFKDNQFDIVYHLAAYAAEGLSPFIRVFNYRNNLLASANLINKSIKYNIKRFVFTSSMAVYGNSTEPPFSEENIPCPIDPYGIAKYSVEQDLKVAMEQHGLEYTVIRPHNVYGINQNIWDRYRNVLGIWMYQIMKGESPTIFGDGEQTRAFSYIDDALEPLWTASQSKDCIGEIINLGGIKSYSINEAARVVLKVTGSDLEPVYFEKRHEAKHAWSTWEKSVELLGFEHKVDLEEGVSRMWDWAKTQPERDRFTWSDFEIDDKIYSFWKK
jgi:UDP-glucose 4-epimerase